MSKRNLKKIELLWSNKYDKNRNLKDLDKPDSFPFQIVESLNVPRIEKKKRENLTLFDFWDGNEGDTFDEGWKNKLIWGDNKLVMASLLNKFSGKINLIYIDPPFATGADFKFKIHIGEDKDKFFKEHSILEEKAYRDTWGSGLDSYLHYMFERLKLMKDLLANDGSIYIHLDWHVGHYIKLIMDEIFGYENFINEIIWRYGKMASSTKKFLSNHDIILLYSKSDKYKFNTQKTKLDKPIKRLAREVKNGRLVNKKDKNGKLVYVMKDTKLVDDVWDDIPTVMHANPHFLDFSTQKPELLLKRIILTSTEPGDIIADFFCGSGTTIATAEKLNRRWIGCDLSRYAIHLTRKRLLEIENSKDLNNLKKKYEKTANPFEILNLGKYERQYWQITTFNNKDEKQLLFEYLAFMLKLYDAEPISGFNYIHGKKEKALIYIGSVDSPITIQEIINAINECKKVNQKEIHFLGWEWEMGLNYAIQEISKKEGINLKLRIIPNNVLEKQAVERGDIQFFELAYFKIDIKKFNMKISIELKDFVIPHTDLIPDQIKSKIKKWTDWIDYWAIDFDFRNNQFNNNWTSYRTRKDRDIRLKAEHIYQNIGTYKIFIKIIDIFGVDTSQIYEIEIE